jgi:hypothetical protein
MKNNRILGETLKTGSKAMNYMPNPGRSPIISAAEKQAKYLCSALIAVTTIITIGAAFKGVKEIYSR